MKIVRWISVGVVILALAVLSLRLLVIRIKPGDIGILNAEWTGGLVEKDFGAGYHWDVGPLHTWRVFDGTVQSMQFNRKPEAAARTSPWRPEIPRPGGRCTGYWRCRFPYLLEHPRPSIRPRWH